MSGGFFDHQQYHLDDIAEAILQEIVDNDKIIDYEFGYSHSYCDETIKKFEEAVRFLHIAKIYVDRIDYLLRGDDNGKTFLNRLKKDLEKYNVKQE